MQDHFRCIRIVHLSERPILLILATLTRRPIRYRESILSRLCRVHCEIKRHFDGSSIFNLLTFGCCAGLSHLLWNVQLDTVKSLKMGLKNWIKIHRNILPGVPTSFRQEFCKKFLKIAKGKKLMKVCLYCSQAVQISLQFDDFFWQKISKFYFRVDFRCSLKLVGTPCSQLKKGAPKEILTLYLWQKCYLTRLK